MEERARHGGKRETEILGNFWQWTELVQSDLTSIHIVYKARKET